MEKIELSGKYLITTDYHFFGPDGKKYRAAWGDVKVIDDSLLGIKTNRNATNWFLRVGDVDNHVIIAGCQIHFAVKCEKKPLTTEIDEFSSEKDDQDKPIRINIYIAQK